MNSINLLIGYLPHFFVVSIYLYCLIFVFIKRDISEKRNSFFVYFLLGALTSLIAIFAIKIIGFVSVLLFYIYDFYFFLRHGKLFNRSPLVLIIPLFCLSIILSFIYKLDEMINILSLIVNISTILIFTFCGWKKRLKDENIFWFNSAYIIHSISILFCDITLIVGKFNDRSWTYLFMYFIIYYVYSIKNILLLKSYKCEFKMNL